MKVKITQPYIDSELRKRIDKDEIIDVTDKRGKLLIFKDVAVEVKESNKPTSTNYSGFNSISFDNKDKEDSNGL